MVYSSFTLVYYSSTLVHYRAQTSLAVADHYPFIAQYGQVELTNVGSWWCKANPKASRLLPAPQSGHATNIIKFLAHLLIQEDSLVLKASWSSLAIFTETS